MMYTFSLFVTLCVCVCVIESTVLCITYHFLCLRSKRTKTTVLSEEAVVRPSVCLSLRWYKRVMCMLLFCAQFFEALIFAIYRDRSYMLYVQCVRRAAVRVHFMLHGDDDAYTINAKIFLKHSTTEQPK